MSTNVGYCLTCPRPTHCVCLPQCQKGKVSLWDWGDGFNLQDVTKHATYARERSPAMRALIKFWSFSEIGISFSFTRESNIISEPISWVHLVPFLLEYEKESKGRGGLLQDLGDDESIKDMAPRPVSKIVAQPCDFYTGNIAFCDHQIRLAWFEMRRHEAGKKCNTYEIDQDESFSNTREEKSDLKSARSENASPQAIHRMWSPAVWCDEAVEIAHWTQSVYQHIYLRVWESIRVNKSR